MRVLNYLFFSAIFITLGGLALFLVTREVVLVLARVQIDQELRFLDKSQTKNQAATSCQSLGGGSIATDQITRQLRFTSSTEYVLEVICPGFSSQPSILSAKTLPVFVSKAPGTSGFVVKPVENGITIETFRFEAERIGEALGLDLSFLIRKKNLIGQSGFLVGNTKSEYLGNGPTTSCEGYGYACCDQIAQVGSGDRISGILGCEQSCFTACLSRPLVLSFNGNPFPDPVERTVQLTKGEVIEFSYTVDFGKSQMRDVVLDFGDGQKETLVEANGQTSHIYACAQAQCKYTAHLIATDTTGVSSASTPISTIFILVQ